MTRTTLTRSPITAASPSWSRRLRALGIGRRRMRRAWTHQRALEVLRTLVYVVPLTLLVWVWAQDQQIETRIQQGVPVYVGHMDGEKVVVVQQTSSGDTVSRQGDNLLTTLSLRGPRIGLNGVIRALENRSALLEVRLSGRTAEQVTVSLRDQLNQLPLLRDSGVTVEQVIPGDLIVSIEDRLRVEARLVAANVSAEELAGPVEFDPPTVMISGPASAVRSLEEPGGEVLLRLPLPDTGPGEHDVNLRVILPRDAPPGLNVNAQYVKARFTRGEQREEVLELKFPIPVHVNAPAALRVTPDGLNTVIHGIRVRGPAHLISRLRTDPPDPALRNQVQAVVTLMRDDEQRVGQEVTRELGILLPPGLQLDGEPPRVTFTVRQLDAQ